MYHGVAMKRTSAVFVTLGLVLILALLIPLANVSADTIKYTKNFGRAATTYTGSISMPSSSFSISESASWITATRTSYYNFKITISENTGDYRSATVKVVNGGTIFNYKICQSAGRFLVTFDNNNGTGGPGTQYKLYSSSITISNIEPTKSGYTFLGWSASSTATAATYLPGATYSTLSSSKLYAVWRQKTVCTVTLWGNGGTLDVNNEEIANYQVYQNDTFILNTTAHRTGYAFQGFATEALATTISYSPSPYTRIPISQNLNLYAIWKGIEYTITFDVNAGDATCSETSRKVSYNDKLGSLPTPTRPDYEFLGWYTESGYQRTSISIMGMANLKLVARWKQINCTLTYDANALTATGTPASVTVKNGTMVTISETRPTRKGYTFMGWATTATATSPNYWYHMGESIKLEADLKLFAVWEQNICGIVFDANGGLITGTSDERVGYSVNQYDWITVKTAVMPGYTFKGWALVEDAEVPDYIQNENLEVSTKMTFYAVWGEIVPIIIDANQLLDLPDGGTFSTTLKGKPNTMYEISKSYLYYDYESPWIYFSSSAAIDFDVRFDTVHVITDEYGNADLTVTYFTNNAPNERMSAKVSIKEQATDQTAPIIQTSYDVFWYGNRIGIPITVFISDDNHDVYGLFGNQDFTEQEQPGHFIRYFGASGIGTSFAISIDNTILDCGRDDFYEDPVEKIVEEIGMRYESKNPSWLKVEANENNGREITVTIDSNCVPLEKNTEGEAVFPNEATDRTGRIEITVGDRVFIIEILQLQIYYGGNRQKLNEDLETHASTIACLNLSDYFLGKIMTGNKIEVRTVGDTYVAVRTWIGEDTFYYIDYIIYTASVLKTGEELALKIEVQTSQGLSLELNNGTVIADIQGFISASMDGKLGEKNAIERCNTNRAIKDYIIDPIFMVADVVITAYTLPVDLANAPVKTFLKEVVIAEILRRAEAGQAIETLAGITIDNVHEILFVDDATGIVSLDLGSSLDLLDLALELELVKEGEDAKIYLNKEKAFYRARQTEVEVAEYFFGFEEGSCLAYDGNVTFYFNAKRVELMMNIPIVPLEESYHFFTNMVDLVKLQVSRLTWDSDEGVIIRIENK